MDFLAPMLVLITTALVFGSVLRSYFLNRRLRDNARLWVELQGKVVDRFGSAPEVVRYLESDAGQRMLEGQVTSSASPHARVLDAVHTGLLVLLGGLGLRAASGVGDAEVRAVLQMVGTVGAILGFGFLLSAAVSWFLLRRWGLLGAEPLAGSGDAA